MKHQTLTTTTKKATLKNSVQKSDCPAVFSPPTLARFEAIQRELKAYEARMAYLQDVAQQKINLQKTGCTPEIRRYRATREDRARLPKTLENLRQQIRLLQHEHEVLKRYGR